MQRILRKRFISAAMAISLLISFLLPDRELKELDRDWLSPGRDIVNNIRYQSDPNCFVSRYDDIFREVSGRHGNHWCLMSAIAYVESRFKPHVVSYSGAVGLMQIMPRTGAIYDVPTHELLDPHRNVETGNIHYNHIEQMLDIPNDTSDRDRTCLILASYNGGIGHVFDAQRLCRLEGEDPHVWANVAKGLLKLRHEEWHSLPLVRFGSFKSARHTVRYVNDVMRKYDEYVNNSANCVSCMFPTPSC